MKSKAENAWYENPITMCGKLDCQNREISRVTYVNLTQHTYKI
jgi:hypothetical protein